MNKKLLLFLFLLPYLSNAQNSKFNTQDLNVSEFDLEAKLYPLDTTANAFFIYEEGTTKFDPKRDYNLVTAYAAKIKILNKEGFDHATIEIPLSKGEKSQEKVENLIATTYNLVNGETQMRRLNPQNVYTKELENYDLLSFTFPNVKPGSVLVYRYELVSPFIFDFTTWRFQDYIPKVFSQFTAWIPGNYEYHTTISGPYKMKTNESSLIENCIDFGGSSELAGCVKTIYAMENIPAFKEEKFSTSKQNYFSKLEYELKQITELDGFENKFTKSWEDVDKELETDKYIGRPLRKDGKVEDILPEEIRSMPKGLEKAKRIYQFVQKEFKWNEKLEIYKNTKLNDFLEERTGNVREINTVLHNFYNSQDFEALPVMAATRGKGFPSKLHPVLSDFNYFFVQLELDGEKYLLDASGKNLDFGQLPYRALNSYARLMDFKNGSSWIDINPKEFSRFIITDSIKVHPDGSASGFSFQRISGYHALEYRDKLEKIDTRELFNDYSFHNEATHAEKIEVYNEDDPSEFLQLKYYLRNQNQKIGDKIYFNPFSFRFIENNPFKRDGRDFPIDFGYKDLYFYSAMIEIPEGYSIKEIPEQIILNGQGGGALLHFSISQIGENVLHAQCQFKLPFTVYPAEYYSVLKQFFDHIMQVQSKTLIVIEENS